jgi:hypothetical protein
MNVLTDVSTGFRYTRVSGYDAKTPEEEIPDADEGSEEELSELEEDDDDAEDSTD